MDVIELISKLNSVVEGRSIYIDENDAFLSNVDGYRGVAIQCDSSVKIDEKFNKVEIKSMSFKIKKELIDVVFLYTKEDKMSEEYGLLCLNFLSQDNREVIKTKPIVWFEEWKNLLGNTKSNKMVYDVIGEMKVLLLLQQKNRNPIWNSTQLGTFDINTKDAIYEVKTTKSRVDNYITIHNQFQLDYEELDRDLYISFVRVEENDSGDSIDSLYNELIEAGFNKITLTNYLDKNGYYVGKTERYIKFLVHNIYNYKVDESFPRITKESFNNSVIPKGIVKLEYTISLEGLDKEILL